jgi:hypothetical protein
VAWGNLGGDDQKTGGGLVPDEPADELVKKSLLRRMEKIEE